MAYQWTSNAQKTWPAAADGIALTPSGSSWTSGAYVTVIASTAEASVLTGVIVRTAATPNQQFEIDIATGASSSEVVIATIKGKAQHFDFTTNTINVRYVFAIPVDAIASSARVSARVRVSGTSVVAWTVSLQYYQKPITGNVQVSAQPIKVLPAAASMTTLTGGASWTYGSWVQLTAAAAAALVLDGFILHLTAASASGEVQIGTGAAASETAIHTIKIDAGNIGGFGYIPLMNPLDNIANGVRVAARVRGNAGSDSCTIAVSYREKPL